MQNLVPTIGLVVYYEHMRTKDEQKQHPEKEPRKTACLLTCYQPREFFLDMLTLCSCLAPGTKLNSEEKKPGHDISFLPPSVGQLTFGRTNFPVRFDGVQLRPFVNETLIRFKTTFAELYSPQAKGNLENFLVLLLCGLRDADVDSVPFVAEFKKRYGSGSWGITRKLGWEYDGAFNLFSRDLLLTFEKALS